MKGSQARSKVRESSPGSDIQASQGERQVRFGEGDFCGERAREKGEEEGILQTKGHANP